MSHRALIFQNADGEGPGILTHCLNIRGWGWKIIAFNLGETIPEDWKNYSLLVVMGGPMNVYEEDAYPFLKDESQILKRAFEKGLPIMGFCLGAQLMAKALNTRVTKGPKKEIGWYPVRLTKQGMTDPLLSSFPEESMVFQWHGDTFDLPKKAIRIFSSKDYPNQAMRFGEMHYGFQFHFEITGDMVREWIIKGRDEIEKMNVKNLEDTILKDTDRCLPKVHSLAKTYFNNYLKRIEAVPETLHQGLSP
jgi:GMP synthase-like glutamine amidotransferase